MSNLYETLRKRFHIDERSEEIQLFDWDEGFPQNVYIRDDVSRLLTMREKVEELEKLVGEDKYKRLKDEEHIFNYQYLCLKWLNKEENKFEFFPTNALRKITKEYKNYGGFGKEERSSFKYWFAHWCAFNMTALRLGIWKKKYLLHDWEKPWLMLLWRDYKRVQHYHRHHHNHHFEYALEGVENINKLDWEAMVIDWECSGFTKTAAAWDAREQLEREVKRWPEYEDKIRENVTKIIDRLKI